MAGSDAPACFSCSRAAILFLMVSLMVTHGNAASATVTASTTASPTVTSTRSCTRTITPSYGTTRTPSNTPSFSKSQLAALSASLSATRSLTVTLTRTRTAAPAASSVAPAASASITSSSSVVQSNSPTTSISRSTGATPASSNSPSASRSMSSTALSSPQHSSSASNSSLCECTCSATQCCIGVNATTIQELCVAATNSSGSGSWPLATVAIVSISLIAGTLGITGGIILVWRSRRNRAERAKLLGAKLRKTAHPSKGFVFTAATPSAAAASPAQPSPTTLKSPKSDITVLVCSGAVRDQTKGATQSPGRTEADRAGSPSAKPTLTLKYPLPKRFVPVNASMRVVNGKLVEPVKRGPMLPPASAKARSPSPPPHTLPASKSPIAARGASPTTRASSPRQSPTLYTSEFIVRPRTVTAGGSNKRASRVVKRSRRRKLVKPKRRRRSLSERRQLLEDHHRSQSPFGSRLSQLSVTDSGASYDSFKSAAYEEAVSQLQRDITVAKLAIRSYKTVLSKRAGDDHGTPALVP